MAVTVERLVAEIEANPDQAIRELEQFDAVVTGSARDRRSSIDVDTAIAQSEVRAFDGVMDTATRNRAIDVDADVAAAIAELLRLEASVDAATRDRSIDVDVNQSGLEVIALGMGKLMGMLDGVADSAGGATSALGGGAGGGGGFSSVASQAGSSGAGFASSLTGLTSGLSGMAMAIIPIMGLISALPGLFAAAAGGVGILLAAIAPLVGLLGMILPALGAFVLVIGTLAAALAPVIQGVSAYKEASADAGQQTQDLAAKQQALVSANQAVTSATQQVTRATEALSDARKALAKAPLEAAEALEDQHFATRQAVLSEKQAVIALENAQKNLSSAQKESVRAGLELTKQTDEFTGKQYDVATLSSESVDNAGSEREARLALAQAELDLAMAKDNTGDQQRLLNEMEAKGIKNSDIMVAARRRVRDAEWGLASARQALANANRSVATAQKDMNTQIDQGTTAMQGWADAAKNLSPAGMDFVKFLADEFMPAFGDISKAAQEGLLPGLQSGMSMLLGVFDEVEDEVRIVGELLGDTFEDFMKFWTGAKGQDELTGMFDALNGVLAAGLRVVKPFSRVLVSLTEAASPALAGILNKITRGLTKLADWLDTKKGRDEAIQFFEDAAYFFGLWVEVMRPAAGILKAITRALKPIAVDWLVGLADDLEGLSDSMNSPEGQETIFDYVSKQMPALEQIKLLIGDIIDLFFNSSVGGEDSAFYKALVAIREDVIPPLKDLFEKLDKSELLPNMIEAVGAIVELLGTVDWDDIGDIIGAIAWAFQGIARAFAFISENEFFRWLINPGFAFIGLLAEGASYIIDNWDALQMYFQEKIFKPIGRFFTETIPNAVRAIAVVFETVWEDLKTWFLLKIALPLGNILTGIWDSLKMGFEAAIQWLKDKWNGFTDWFKEHTPDMPDLNPGEGGGIDLTPWDGLIPGNWSGGPLKKGEVSWVGENGPELFAPSQGGRIMPAVPSRESMQSTGGGIDPAHLDRIVERLAEKMKPDQNIQVTTNNEADPVHVSRQIAWGLR